MPGRQNVTEISYAELHMPLFLAGKNFGSKIGDKLDHRTLEMKFDEAKKRMVVTYMGKTAQIPESAIAYWIEGGKETQALHSSEQPNRRIVAQVETPQSHVHAGRGYGKASK